MKIEQIRRYLIDLDMLDLDKANKKILRLFKTNKDILESELEKLVKARNYLCEREQQRMTLAYKFCERDINGEPVMRDGKLAGLENNLAYQKAQKDLESYYQEGVNFYKTLQDKPIENLHLLTIRHTDIPMKTHNKVHLQRLKGMIKYNDIAVSIFEEEKCLK